MSTRSASASSRSERRPVTSRATRPGTPWSVPCAPRRGSSWRPSPAATPLAIVCASQAAGLTPSAPGTVDIGTRAGADERGGERDVAGLRRRPGAAPRRPRRRPVAGIGTATPSGVRASTTPSNGTVSTDASPSASSQRARRRARTRRPSSTGRSKPVVVDRPHAPADAIARLDTTTSKPASTRCTRGGEPGDAGADHGRRARRVRRCAATCSAAASPESRAPVSVPGSPAEQASPANQSRSPTGSRGTRGARACADGVERERAAREGVGAPARAAHRRRAAARRRAASASGVGVGRRASRSASGVGRRLGRGHVQLESATAAIPESDAARKVRRAMPPDAARESMGLRLADRLDGGRRRRRGARVSVGGHARHGTRPRTGAGPPRSSPSWRSARCGRSRASRTSARAARARPRGRAPA